MALLAIENASSSSSSSSIPPSSTPGCKYEYDVFLSFRGIDTRNNFTDHLYYRLKQEGIFTFRDDERLEQGTEINSGLLRAIDESKIAVAVLSKQYASSSWCLIELAKIVECMDKKKLTVLPVFHYVDPSDVKYQRGSFAEAFAEHENRFKDKIDDVKTWRAALTEVAKLAGWHLKDNTSEPEVIRQIIQRINSELDREVPFVSEHPVGMDSRVKEMLDLYLGERLDCVRLVGICGMGGIGKTTLAREIYNRIFRNFEVSSFIANVREEFESRRLVSLQNNLLSKILMGIEKNISNVEEGKNILRNRLCNRKVFIVLDDVNDDEQLKALAGNSNWFGPGSIIIVTSRDIHLLNSYWDGEIDIYIAKGLNDKEAMELFSLKAFKKTHPKENYVDLSINFVSYANGHPLALKVLGSSLFGKTLDVWISARDKLEAEPNRGIMDVLKISFDGLDDTQKDLFLDIAFLFENMDDYRIRDTLESLGHYTCDIHVLQDKSLITIASDRALWMHDLLKKMGRDIVRCESPEPGKRSRLWTYKDVLHVLTSNSGTEVVKGIMLNMPFEAYECLSAEAFTKMKILRFLKIGYVHPRERLIGGPIQLPQGLNYLSNELRIIDWHGYPLKFMPTGFQPNKLVKLRMHNSDIKQLWKGIMILNELKLIDLRNSQNLIETPNLSGVPNLEQLILNGCTGLSNIHPSLGDLKRLIELDLNGCKNLKSLPHKINLEALEFFNLSGCSKLKKFPNIVEDMPRLSKLYLSETAIKDLSLLVIHSYGLLELHLRDCKNLSSLPIAICSLMSLKTLNLSGCTKLDELPENLGKIEGLEVLDLSRTAITSLPSFVHLKNLKVLSLSKCVGPPSKSFNKLTRFLLMQPRRSPDPMGMLERSLTGLCSLTTLDLSYSNVQTIPNVLGCLSSLQRLDLRGNNFVCLPESIIQLSNLRELYMAGCAHLRMLPKLPLNIEYISATNCTSLETVSLRPEYEFRPQFCLLGCNKLIKNQDYGDLYSTMLRRYLIDTQVHHDLEGFGYGMLIPGCEVPKCFSHQNVGGSVNLQVPSDLFRNKLMGIAVCAVFVFRKHHRGYLWCSVNGLSGVGIRLPKEFGKIESYQLLLHYFPSTCYEGIKKILNQVDINGFSQIEVKFRSDCPGLEVTKCGARLVLSDERDIEDLINQTKAGPSSCIITPYDEDGFDDSEKDTKIKRSSDDSDGEGAGPCGEATSNDIDIPHPKSVQFPNLTQRLMLCLGNWIGSLCAQRQVDSDCEEEEFQ